jgi:hypothetical protein
MLPHLEPIARALDDLDEEYYIDFDTSNVPVLILYEQERNRYTKEEFTQGLISLNEYRDRTGRKEVDSDLADSLLLNPNLTPIANTKKKMEQPAQAGVAGPPGGAGMPGMPGMPPGDPGMPPGAMPGAEGAPPDPTTMQGAMELASQGQAMAEGAGMAPAEAAPVEMAPQQASAPKGGIQTKSADDKEETTLTRWTEILDRSLERIFERQQRVVLEKAAGVKARKQLVSGFLDTESIFQLDAWSKQIEEDIKPVLNAIIADSQTIFAEKSLIKTPITSEDVVAQVNSQITRIKSINDETGQQITNAILGTLNIGNEDDKATALRASLVGIFTNLIAKKKNEIAESEARIAWSMGSRM